MGVVTNVFRRGTSFYFRVRVPSSLRDRVGRTELWRSLKTSLAGEARRRGVYLHILTEALWRDLERVMDLGECKALIEAWLRAEIEEDAYLRSRPEGETYVAVEMRRRPAWAPDEVVRELDHDDLDAHKALTPEARNAALSPDRYLLEEISERALQVRGQRKIFSDAPDRLFRRDTDIAEHHVRTLFKREGVEVSEFGSLFEAATKMMLKAQADVARAIIMRDAADWEEWLGEDPAAAILAAHASATPRAPAARRSTPRSDTPMPFSAAAEVAIVELTRLEGLAPKRTDDYRNAVATFLDWIEGDPDLKAIEPEDAGEFATALSHYPSNASKRPQYLRAGSFRERLKIAREGGDKRLLSSTTINGKYLTPLRRIFDWHRTKGVRHPNPFEGITVRAPKTADPSKARRDFSLSEIKRLFALPLFTGAAGVSGRKLSEPGIVRIGGWRFWIAPICLLSGMRLNEACGLAVADVKTENGIWFFHVRDDLEVQRLKTAAARRKVPVHSQLIDLGLLDMVSEAKGLGHERLFPDLEPDASGYLSRVPSKFFGTLIKGICDEDPDNPGKLVFHSTRHTVVGRLRAAGVREDVSKELVGHEQGEVHGGYGDTDIPTLKRAVESIAYPGLDLSALRGPKS